MKVYTAHHESPYEGSTPIGEGVFASREEACDAASKLHGRKLNFKDDTKGGCWYMCRDGNSYVVLEHMLPEPKSEVFALSRVFAVVGVEATLSVHRTWEGAAQEAFDIVKGATGSVLGFEQLDALEEETCVKWAATDPLNPFVTWLIKKMPLKSRAPVDRPTLAGVEGGA